MAITTEQTIEKIKTLYNHPSTHPNIKQIARNKLKELGVDVDVNTNANVSTITFTHTRPPSAQNNTKIRESDSICTYLNRMGYANRMFSPSFVEYNIAGYKIIIDIHSQSNWSIYARSSDFLSNRSVYNGSTFAQFKSTFDKI